MLHRFNGLRANQENLNQEPQFGAHTTSGSSAFARRCPSLYGAAHLCTLDDYVITLFLFAGKPLPTVSPLVCVFECVI